MDIENIETHGQAGIEFTDRTGTPVSLWILENIKDLRFDLDTDFSQFSQEDIKALLPYLEAYVNSGTLDLQESPKQEAPLQKGSVLEESIKKTASLVRRNHELESELSTMQEAGIAMASNIVDQGKCIEELRGDLAQAVSHIKDLEKLLREWKKYGQALSDSRSPDELVCLTEQLLGEDQ